MYLHVYTSHINYLCIKIEIFTHMYKDIKTYRIFKQEKQTGFHEHLKIHTLIKRLKKGDRTFKLDPTSQYFQYISVC